MNRVFSIIPILSFAVAFSASAYEPQANVKFPNSLKCKDILCALGRDGCQASDAALEIREINSSNGPLILDSTRGVIEQKADSDRVTLNFSDGDQMSTITFLKDDVAELSAGKTKSIRGIRDVGYWWMDGDHTDAVFVTECR